MLETTLTLNRIKCRALLHNASGTPIVFLHGYSFTIDIWNDIGILAFLENKDIPFLALDLPYGLNSQCSRKTRDLTVNIQVVRAARDNAGDEEPVLVGASLGGYIAMHYVVTYPSRGVLVIAPVNTQEELLTQCYTDLNIPVHIVYGTRDSIVTQAEMEMLDRQLPHSKLVVYDDAPHPAYLHNPEAFRRDLLELYNQSTRG